MVRSIVMSGRPSTSRAKERIMQRRWSEGSTGRAGELEMPREAFQRFRDSSFWSGQGMLDTVWRLEWATIALIANSEDGLLRLRSNCREGDWNEPSFAYSSTVFFSPAL